MPGSVQSIERAAGILQLIAGSCGRFGVTEIAARINLPKTTAHGLLRTLLQVGFVEQESRTGHYRLGAVLLGMGHPDLDVHELRSRSSNWADSLAARSGLAVRLGVLQVASMPALSRLSGPEVIVVHHVFRPDDSVQQLDAGTRLPAHATALGKVLLAFPGTHPGPVDHLERWTAATTTAADRLDAALQAVREQGWAAEREEHLVDVAGLAAPVRGQGGRVVAALGVTGPVAAVFSGRGRVHPVLLGLLTDAATSVSRELVRAA